MGQTKAAIYTQLEKKLAHLLKKHFGRGAESLYIQWEGPAITIHLRQFLAPMEQTLLTQSEAEVEEIERLRDKIMLALLPSIRSVIEMEIDETIDELYYDWRIHPDQSPEGMIWGLLDSVPQAKQSPLRELLEPVRQQNDPSQGPVYACWVGNDQLLVEKEGALKAIEHELIYDGHENTWRQTKKISEQKGLARAEWEQWFQRSLHHVFMDWNVRKGKEYMVLYFERPSRAADTPQADR